MKFVGEPYRSAYLEVLYRVAIHVRSHSTGEHRLPDLQLHLLMDAIHNIPLYLKSGDEDCVPAIRDAFKWHDKKFPDSEIRLEAIFEHSLRGSERST